MSHERAESALIAVSIRPSPSRRFPPATLAALAESKILGVRAGSEHRYTGVWPVVVEGRLFVRSWNDKPTGWYRAFLEQPLGSIQLGDRELGVRAARPRSPRMLDAVSLAFARKYDTKASKKWVDGFAEPTRRPHTLELVPR
jgi:hypothetical protein